MNDGKTKDLQYKKAVIDNAVCGRRFHIAFEEGGETLPHVKIACPHCGETVFEANHHAEAILSREENLTQSPDGSFPIIYNCSFNSK